VDCCDQVYVQYVVFLWGFLQLLLFTDLMVLKSPEGPQNHSLALIPDAEVDTVSLGSIILVLPEFSFS